MECYPSYGLPTDPIIKQITAGLGELRTERKEKDRLDDAKSQPGIGDPTKNQVIGSDPRLAGATQLAGLRANQITAGLIIGAESMRSDSKGQIDMMTASATKVSCVTGCCGSPSNGVLP